MSSPNRRENDRLRKVNRIMLVRSTKTSRIRSYRKGAKTAATSTVNIRQPFSQNLPTAARSNQQKDLDRFNQAYRIFRDKELGSGQFGFVYEGIHLETQRPVAVKVISTTNWNKNESRFLREKEILKSLSHPGVIKFQDFFETPNNNFLITEILDDNLFEMIMRSEGRRLDERTVRFLAIQILVAVKYLHSKDIAHCDLKPDNILVSTTTNLAQVKLCDFGSARIIQPNSSRNFPFVGTEGYRAPEMILNQGWNRSSDMWSVGVVIYVCLSGTYPIDEKKNIKNQIEDTESMYPQNQWKRISPGGEAVKFIPKLLEIDPNKRYTVERSLGHLWIQQHLQTWQDLIEMEKQKGVCYVTQEIDPVLWHDFSF